jgi:hypothetical protein
LDEIEIHGKKIEMEERICAGGCGLVFRCMKSSSHKLARIDCELVCAGKHLSLKDIKQIRLDRRKAKNKEWDEKRTSAMNLFNENIKNAKLLYQSNKEENRFEIAQLALDVCFDNYAFKLEKKLRKGLTFNRFSKSVGMDAHTLTLWTTIKRELINQLGMEFYEKGTYAAAKKIVKKLRYKTDPERVRKLFMDECISDGSWKGEI